MPSPSPQRPEAPPSRPGGRGGTGYTLVVLAVAITVLNIMVAAALPYWSKAMQREKEEELIFRGLQYAEGIRLFQRRFGRLPVRLEELIEVEPRCMRQLYEDPMTESGKWGLIMATPPGRNPNQPGQRGGQPDRPGAGNDQQRGQQPPLNDGRGGPEDVVLPGEEGEDTQTVGPITGVRSLSDEDSLLEFNGQTTYDKWEFRLGMVTGAVGIPGQSGLPALNVKWLGRPVRQGLQPPPGGGLPTQLQDNPNLGGGGQGREGQNPGAGPRGRRRTLPNTIPRGNPQPPENPGGRGDGRP